MLVMRVIHLSDIILVCKREKELKLLKIEIGIWENIQNGK